MLPKGTLGKKQTWWVKMVQQPEETSKILNLGYDNLEFILSLVSLCTRA